MHRWRAHRIVWRAYCQAGEVSRPSRLDTVSSRYLMSRPMISTPIVSTHAAANAPNLEQLEPFDWPAGHPLRAGRARLLVHVVEPIAVAPQWQPYIEDADQARVADARTQLEKLTKQFAGSVECESLVESGRPADSIALIADQRRAGVIVMGLASSQGPLGSRPGSIAYRVLCLAKAPVLVVPPQSVTESPQE